MFQNLEQQIMQSFSGLSIEAVTLREQLIYSSFQKEQDAVKKQYLQQFHEGIVKYKKTLK
jgi:hypothetical protein